MKRKIHIASLDFDGCVFHYAKPGLPRYGKQVIHKNKILLDDIQAKSTGYDQRLVCIGSARQSQEDDRYNSERNATESCFIAIETIANALNATLDTFLLADIYGRVSSGYSYWRARNMPAELKHHRWEFDDTKLTILYAQIHRIACQYPDDEIVFDFYDDRGLGLEKDILDNLYSYFFQYPDLLPHNVTLRLNHYKGKTAISFQNIFGRGIIDKNYQETVLDIKSLLTTPHPFDCLPTFLLHRAPLLSDTDDEFVMIGRPNHQPTPVISRLTLAYSFFSSISSIITNRTSENEDDDYILVENPLSLNKSSTFF